MTREKKKKENNGGTGYPDHDPQGYLEFLLSLNPVTAT
jgi:hypothetical protein